jgi:ribosomal protein S27E
MENVEKKNNMEEVEKVATEIEKSVSEKKELLKVKCSGCKEEYTLESFVKGVTPCPKCGLKSLLDFVKPKQAETTSSLERKNKKFIDCTNCGVVYLEELSKDGCPKCGSTNGKPFFSKV